MATATVTRETRSTHDLVEEQLAEHRKRVARDADELRSLGVQRADLEASTADAIIAAKLAGQDPVEARDKVLVEIRRVDGRIADLKQTMAYDGQVYDRLSSRLNEAI